MSNFRAERNSLSNSDGFSEALEVSMHDHSYRTVDPSGAAGPSSAQQASNGVGNTIRSEKRPADGGALLSLQPGSKVYITGNIPMVRPQQNVTRLQVPNSSDNARLAQNVVRGQTIKTVSISSAGMVQQIVIPSANTSPVKSILPAGKLPISQFKTSPSGVTMVPIGQQAARKPGVVVTQLPNTKREVSANNFSSSVMIQNNPSIIVPVNQDGNHGSGQSVLHVQQVASGGVQRVTNANTKTQQQQVASGKAVPRRLILPATPAVSLPGGSVMYPAGSGGGVAGGSLSSLPPGATLLSSSQSLPAGFQGYALIPAQFVSQLQRPGDGSAAAVIKQEPGLRLSGGGMDHGSRSRVLSATGSQADLASTSSANRSRKPCNCTKSQCLKLYCDCFANGEFCNNCNCVSCYNNIEHDDARSRAIKACLDRNPLAFHPKIGKDKTVEGERRHNKGCNCKRSGCLKNYCECYEAKILCTSLCKCVGCRNCEESADQRTLMHLANAAEVREHQQRSIKDRLTTQHMMDTHHSAAASLSDNTATSSKRLPYTFVTPLVTDAACSCLVAQAEEAEVCGLSEDVGERMVLEEFGRCLLQIIDSANRTRAPSP